MTTDIGHKDRIGVVRLAATGALAAGIFYTLCWFGALILPIGPASHMYLQLFTSADPLSPTALIQGVVWSVSFGFIGGALVAALYNSLSRLQC